MEQQHTLVISPKRKDVYRSMTEDFEQRECVNVEEQSRFDDEIMAASERLKQAGKQHQHVATLPIGQPDPIPKKTWRKRDTHDKATARALTAAEVAERDLKAAERCLKAKDRRDKKQRANTPESVAEGEEEEVQVPATPERLPPSIAPARLVGEGGEGRGKRKRKMTEAYRQARQAGLQSLGYSQVEE